MATCSPYSKEKANHIRLCNLLVDIGRQVFQDVFDNIHLPSPLNVVLSSNKRTLNNLRTMNILFKKQWDTLFPASGAVTSADFDITLLFLLLRNICNLKAPGTGWDKPPLVSDLSMEADLVRIKRCRNELYAHIINTAIPDNEFQTLWGDIEAALLRLCGSKYQVQIQNFKDETIDPESEIRFKVLWQSWEEGEEKTLNAVLEGSAQTLDAIGELHEKVDKALGLKKIVDELQKKVDNLELEKTAKTMDAIGELQENADKAMELSPCDKDLLRFIVDVLKEKGVQRERINIDKSKNEDQIYGGSEAEIAAGKDQVKCLIQDYYLYNKRHGKFGKKNKRHDQGKSTEELTKVGIPIDHIGLVIGEERSNLRRIREKTGADIDDAAIYVQLGGSDDQRRKAAIELKTNVYSAIYTNNTQETFTLDRFDFVDGTGPVCNYRLEQIDCPTTHLLQHDDFYKIDKVDEDEDNEIVNGKIDMIDLESTVTKVLQKIQQTVTTDGSSTYPKSDFWLHFGHVFITGNVDDVEQGETYSLDDFQKQFNQEKGWKMVFDSAVENMDVEGLKEALAGNEYMGIPPHTRYDISFLTPSCGRIRVKIFLDADNRPTKELIHESIAVRPAHSSSAPYLLCDQFYHRLEIHIAIPSTSIDVCLNIRTVSTCLTKTQQELDEETKHEEFLKTYLDRIEIQNGEIKLPDDLPDDFYMNYMRKCKRRSYSYDKGEESFTIVISEEQEIDPWDDAKQFDVKTDIHIKSNEINKLLRSEEWEPEQIIGRLPTFLSVVREIQANISTSEDCW